MITKFIYGDLAISVQKNDLWLHTNFQVSFKNLSKPMGLLEKYNLLHLNLCKLLFCGQRKSSKGILLKT